MDKTTKTNQPKSQLPWLKLGGLGFELYKDNSREEKQFVLVANGSPINQEVVQALVDGGFTKTESGYEGKIGLRTSATLNALPGAQQTFVLPEEIDYPDCLSQKVLPVNNEAPLIGEKWSSAMGEREVISSCKPNAEILYCVSTQGQKHHDWYMASDLEKIMVLDQDPATKWRKWEILNPHEPLKFPQGYAECHIYKKADQKVVRVAGKPVAFEGYEDFAFFMAKHQGRWNVYEQTTGLSITSTNGLKTQKEAMTTAKENLHKHAGSPEKLSQHLSGKLIIPQPGEIELPPPQEKEFTLPDLQTYEDAQEWIKEKAIEYGSRNKLFASAEYKAVYPTIQRLHAQEKENLILEARQAVADAGLSSGDEVFYLSPDKASGMYGKLYFANTGMPRVNVHTEFSLLGGKIPSNKRVDWHKGWDSAVHQQNESHLDNQTVKPVEELAGLTP